MLKPAPYILPIIVISQFCCTSLWFASNAVMNDLITSFNLSDQSLGHFTSSVQIGFILGTLIFAVLTIADRFSPSKVFLFCAIMGSAFNFAMVWDDHTFYSILFLRFLTGFFLAGIYPVGMKIASDYYTKGLGKSLGFLVGALVLGTAFPHLLKDLTQSISWKAVINIVSLLAMLGGSILFFFVPDGPHRKASQQLDVSAFLKIFRNVKFRSAAFGYFGHMWELYAFWAFVPIILKTYSNIHPEISFNVSILSFLIIGVGGLSCIIAGYISAQKGTKKIAFIALLLSCICCLVSPFIFLIPSSILFISFLIFWGMVVVADSPLFSTLVAQNAPVKIKGTALTIVNCIGFSITIISIQLLNQLSIIIPPHYLYLILALGPILGLWALKKKT